MSESWNIRNFEELLLPSLQPGEKIIGKKVSPLTAPGENFGSIMLRIDLDLKNDNTGKERKLNTVAKLVPESELTQKVFNTQRTYRTEYTFYAEIVPIFDRLLKSKGISSGADFIAPFFGGRLNLDGTEVVNSDAVILLQNLKTEGYTIGKKIEGSDMEASKVVLNALAKFHASGIAVRFLEPQTFEKNILPFLNFYLIEDAIYNLGLNTSVEELSKHGFTPEEMDVIAGYKKKGTQRLDVNKTWGTMVHFDSWTNNFLIKYEDTKPIHAVIVDFQICDYRSPLDDVMFFLFTSVKQDTLEESLDTLLDYYYKQLLGYLETLEVDTQPFTKSSYEEEIKFTVKNYEYAHALWMLLPMMNEGLTSVEDIPDGPMSISEVHKQKIVQVTKICFKRGWLSVK